MWPNAGEGRTEGVRNNLKVGQSRETSSEMDARGEARRTSSGGEKGYLTM